MSIHPAFKARGLSNEAAQAARDNEVKDLRREIHELACRVTEMEKVRALVTALIEKDANTKRYVEWLKEKYGIGK